MGNVPIKFLKQQWRVYKNDHIPFDIPIFLNNSHSVMYVILITKVFWVNVLKIYVWEGFE